MSRRRFTREDWIGLGRGRLAGHGPDGVKLDAIRKAARLTRGSFYHHFRDHPSFLVAVAEAWFVTDTQAVIAGLDEGESAAANMDVLTSAALRIDYRLEIGIRELARRLPAVHAIVRKADTCRLDLLTEFYRKRFDLKPEVARSYAFLEYAAFSGLILLDPAMPVAQQKALATLYATTVSATLREPDPWRTDPGNAGEPGDTHGAR